MPRRILHFLQAIYQKARAVQAALPERQAANEQDTRDQPIISILQTRFGETDALPMTPFLDSKRPIEPLRPFVRLNPPAQRYRELDAMLEQLKKDRLNAMETQLVLKSEHELALRLQHEIEQE